MNNRLYLRFGVILTGIFAFVSMARSGDPVQPFVSGQPANAVSVRLQYQEVPYTVINSSLTVTQLKTPFKKEPAIGKADVRRGRFKLPGKGAEIAYLWNGTGKLWLDLNNNGDLTDDPAGTFSSPDEKSNWGYSHGTFTNILFNIQTDAGIQPWRVDLSFSEYSSGFYLSAASHSLWAAKVVLAGKEWQVGLVETPPVQTHEQHGSLLLRPWSRHEQAFNAYDGSFDTFSLPKQVFVPTQMYDVSCVAVQNGGNADYSMTFAPAKTDLGELQLPGEFISRILLEGTSCPVVLDEPGKSVQVPVGRYNGYRIVLRKGTAMAHTGNYSAETKSITIENAKPFMLNAGGPLTNTVAARSHGANLQLDYKLIGAGGETYELANTDRKHPPKFAIYKDQKKLTSGEFQYG